MTVNATDRYLEAGGRSSKTYLTFFTQIVTVSVEFKRLADKIKL